MKLLKDEIVTIQIFRLQGETSQAIALRFRISEGSVRYHLKRQAQKAIDGRAKLSLVEIASNSNVKMKMEPKS